MSVYDKEKYKYSVIFKCAESRSGGGLTGVRFAVESPGDWGRFLKEFAKGEIFNPEVVHIGEDFEPEILCLTRQMIKQRSS